MNRIEHLIEALKPFKGKGEDTAVALNPAKTKKVSGEGIAGFSGLSGSIVTAGGMNSFYNTHINKAYENEIKKMAEYRMMAQTPEIADVIEDACNESIQSDEEGKTLKLLLIDEKLSSNKNISKTLDDEFEKLFYSILNINKTLWEFLRSFYIDGRIYYERIINESKKKEGIISIKKLPSETMDFDYDNNTNKITAFYQILKGVNSLNVKPTFENPDINKDVIIFYPAQIGYVNSGMYGRTIKEVLGYLEKAKIPYNQLKLLETSVIIYRLIRSPERFVFKIDTGSMPIDKAMKFVESVKNSMSKKQTFDPSTGRLTNKTEIFSMLENYFLPVNQDGRGSDIESIGGNAAGFAELDDIYYFSRKLYRSLKYPMSRVSASQEKRESDVIFGGQSFGEISRDEIKWARYLERQNGLFEEEMTDLFLLHLQFKGLKAEYGLNRSNLKVFLDPPNNYKEQILQKTLETQFSNYQTLSQEEDFSTYYLMKKYLKMDDNEIEENYKGFEKDREFRKKYMSEPEEEEGGDDDYYSGYSNEPETKKEEPPKEEPKKEPEDK